MRSRLRGIWQRKALQAKQCRFLILGFCMVFAFVVVTGSTLAWFISTDSSVNNLHSPPAKGFSAAVVDIFNPSPRPGKTYSKRVGAVNQEEKPAFIRLLVMPVLLAADGETVLPAEFGTHVTLTDANLATWSASGWSGGDWADGGDGYYYYLHALPGNTSTDTGGLNQNLFNTVKVADNLPAEYKGANLWIEVKCEAVGIGKWQYRTGWWGRDTAPADQTLGRIDTALSALAK
jgi:hypothetical protein